MKKTKNTLNFYLNGKLCELPADLPPHSLMLADFLRRERSLTGTKIVCAEGDCGACTVLRFFENPGSRRKSRFVPINACITPTALMHGSSLVTVDALKSHTPVQKAMIECHGSQCGFCTPGFVMALTGLLEKSTSLKSNSAPSENHLSAQQTKNALTGNLCRCTGYQPIIDAAVSIPLDQYESLEKLFATPEQRRVLRKIKTEAIQSERFAAPITVQGANRLLKKGTRFIRIIGAATDLGVVHNKGKEKLGSVLSLHLIPELYEIRKTKSTFRIGARVTLTELRDAIKKDIPELARFLDLFASPQIKNAATLVGNVCNGSPIGDTLPFLLVTQAEVHITGKTKKRKVAIEKFYTGYRKNVLKPGEWVTAIEFGIPEKDALTLRKISQRKDLDISTVSAACFQRFQQNQLKETRIAFGGVAATPLRLFKTEKAVLQKRSTEAVLNQFHAEITPMNDLRGSAAFRRVVAENLFKTFFEGIL